MYHDGGEELKARHECTDVPCCLVFLASLVGLGCLYSYGLSHGNIAKLYHGIDYQGKICGIDFQSCAVLSSVILCDVAQFCEICKLCAVSSERSCSSADAALCDAASTCSSDRISATITSRFSSSDQLASLSPSVFSKRYACHQPIFCLEQGFKCFKAFSATSLHDPKKMNVEFSNAKKRG